MKIFNELSSIYKSKHEIERHLLEHANHCNNDQFEIYFVDGTTTYFEGTECTLGKPGKDKTTGFKTHMLLLMLVTNKQGFPCAWEVFSGNKKEVSEFKQVMQRICSKYQITDITFCFDRGFASLSNFNSIENFKSKFISGINKDQIAIISFHSQVIRELKKRAPQYKAFLL
ncbi:MAG: transposase, partial [bacterium]|nr:transposase [bacterium]